MSVKRNQFIKHLESQLHRHGSKHDVYPNIVTKKKTTVPGHPQIDKHLSEAICKQLEIPNFRVSKNGTRLPLPIDLLSKCEVFYRPGAIARIKKW